MRLVLLSDVPPDPILLDLYCALGDDVRVHLVTLSSGLRNGSGFPTAKLEIQALPATREGGFRVRDLNRILSDADLVQVFGMDLRHLAALLAAREKHSFRVVICGVDNAISTKAVHSSPKADLQTRILELDAFLVHSRGAWRLLRLEGVPETKLHLIAPGVDTDRFELSTPDPQVAAKLGITTEHFVALYWGPLSWDRGVYEIMGAAREIRRWGKDSEVRLLMFGKGPEKDCLRDMIRREDMGHFVCLGEEPHPDRLPGILGLADVFLVPSIPTRAWNEPLPLRMLLAMASGLPVIASAIGEIPDFLEQGGVLIQPRNHYELGNAVVRFSENPSALTPYSRAARARAVDRFSIGPAVGRLRDLYEKLLH